MKTLTTVLWLNEADALRLALEREGIAVFLPDQFAAQSDPFLSQAMGGIRVQVGDEDYEKALQVASDFLNARSDTSSTQVAQDWRCPRCGEIVDGTLGACWKCETLRS